MHSVRARHLLLMSLGFTALVIGPAVAQQAPQQVLQMGSDEAATVAKPGANSKVCEYEKVTGSRMKKRVCYTPEQWEARQHAAKDAKREMDAKPMGRTEGI